MPALPASASLITERKYSLGDQSHAFAEQPTYSRADDAPKHADQPCFGEEDCHNLPVARATAFIKPISRVRS